MAVPERPAAEPWAAALPGLQWHARGMHPRTDGQADQADLALRHRDRTAAGFRSPGAVPGRCRRNRLAEGFPERVRLQSSSCPEASPAMTEILVPKRLFGGGENA